MKTYIRTTLVLLLTLSITACQSQTLNETTAKQQGSKPAYLLWNRGALDSYRTKSIGDLASSSEDVLKQADQWKKKKPPTVVEKTVLPPGATLHDYVSMAIYYWPDPNKPDGKPYINKDGQVNPEINDPKQYDAQRMGHMITATDQLSLAYSLTGDQSYAEAATQYLKTWFIDASTKMNPNMTFAQGVPGKTTGSATGIIDGWRLINVVDSVHMIEGSKAWTAQNDQELKKWFKDYLEWLKTSEAGKKEGRMSNNHSVWLDAQTASFAWFTEQNEVAKNIVNGAKKRVDTQIEPDGTMPLELKRTKSWHYTVFNLEAFITLARVGDQVGANLWDYQSKDGSSIRKAWEYAYPYAIGKKTWEQQDIVGVTKNADFARYLGMLMVHDSTITSFDIFTHVLQGVEGEERIATQSFTGSEKTHLLW